MTSSELTTSLANELGSEEAVSTQLIKRAAYASDASHFFHVPEAVVTARSAEDVAAVFRAAKNTNTPVTLRSGGTSLSGQASGEGILVDTRRHFRGIDVLDGGKRVKVQPGATVRHVNARLGLYGYKIGPDPASEIGATIGGVIANNSSGMFCGTALNTYQTIESMTFVLPSGTVINTADTDADEKLRTLEPHLATKLEELRERVRGNADSRARIEKLYSIKNTMGYGMNSFIDHDRPLKILEHLIIGSEGTLAFVAEAIFRTIPVAPLVTTSLAVFNSLDSATRTLPGLVESGAATLELMDSASIKRGQTFAGAPQAIAGFEVNEEAALLIEYHTDEQEKLTHLEAVGERILQEHSLMRPATFSTDKASAAEAWSFRKGLYAQVAGARPKGTTALLEDVAVPVTKLADACAELQDLFASHSYDDAVIFGHAKDGNIHFMLSDRFDNSDSMRRFEDFHEGMVDLVLGVGGNLKAEHGTGRAMAPFVEKQFGTELYQVMWELKRAADPTFTMNPGVILSEDKESHLKDIKLLPEVEPEIEKCVECGFCESSCPSRDLTLTPRQRIVVRRARARALDSGDTAAAKELDRDYEYWGVQTCAADSMCAVACPVNIDTGEFVKNLRADSAKPAQERAWDAAAKNWAPVNRAASLALSSAYIMPESLVRKVTDVARSLAGTETFPQYQSELPKGGQRRSRFGQVVGNRFAAPVGVYVPACVNSMFGSGVSDAFVSLLERAGVSMIVPDIIDELCCGTTWSSKGMRRGLSTMERKVISTLTESTDGGRLPVITDASSCTQGFVHTLEAVGIPVMDAISFTADSLIPLLSGSPVGTVTVHPTCSGEHLSLHDDTLALASFAANEVHVPENWGCCGYAGDRGMLHPELTASATQLEATRVAEFSTDYYVSTNRTCELGMTRATGQEYKHVLELVELATRG
ncbi:FAD-binding and (Fe-S)-binding domain-containing protein [Corynebacterium lubricantis]|uniref:FAD-binding and (Fe-S)-binding domain-containing protein n=1 Tax=Corynebacterium lubricantis TaxID=541095 RepID=UPI00036BA06E|nr:FAD-binding and (Fe-S)-binding domain-containing protein [Corynebacterium lubricantis]